MLPAHSLAHPRDEEGQACRQDEGKRRGKTQKQSAVDAIFGSQMRAETPSTPGLMAGNDAEAAPTAAAEEPPRGAAREGTRPSKTGLQTSHCKPQSADPSRDAQEPDAPKDDDPYSMDIDDDDDGSNPAKRPKQQAGSRRHIKPGPASKSGPGKAPKSSIHVAAEKMPSSPKAAGAAGSRAPRRQDQRSPSKHARQAAAASELKASTPDASAGSRDLMQGPSPEKPGTSSRGHLRSPGMKRRQPSPPSSSSDDVSSEGDRADQRGLSSLEAHPAPKSRTAGKGSNRATLPEAAAQRNPGPAQKATKGKASPGTVAQKPPAAADGNGGKAEISPEKAARTARTGRPGTKGGPAVLANTSRGSGNSRRQQSRWVVGV